MDLETLSDFCSSLPKRCRLSIINGPVQMFNPTFEGGAHGGVPLVEDVANFATIRSWRKDPPGSVKRYVKDKGYSTDHK